GGDGGVLAGVGGAVEADVGEDAVVAVHRGRGDGFAIDGRDSLPQLAGGFGDQLLHPGAEVVDFRRREDGDLVAAGVGGGAEDEAELHSGILGRRLLGGGDGLGCLGEEPGGFEAGDGGGNNAEVGQRGVAAADLRVTVKDGTESVGLGDLLHFGAGIGDGEEVAARFFSSDGL